MELSSLKVLILDDSPVAVQMIRNFLIKMGFSDDLIHSSLSPKLGVLSASRVKFDLIICDYNFNSTLNGKQVLEELRHHSFLTPSCAFILVTGDSTINTVNSVLEVGIDDYILKPFNYRLFSQRVKYTVQCKKDLEEIYVCISEGNFSDGIEVCDRLLSAFPLYQAIIKRERGGFLERMELWRESADYYAQLSMGDSSQWVDLGLSNSLRKLGKLKEAKEVLRRVLTSSPNSIEAIKQLALIEIERGEIPSSIENLELVRSLTKYSSERELALSNLCLSVNDFDNAYRYYKNYFVMNRDTYRNDIFAKLNLVRRLLMKSNSSSEFDDKHEVVESLLLDMSENKGLTEVHKFALECVTAHLLLLKKQYRSSLYIISSCYEKIESGELNDLIFYDLHYFCYILQLFSFDSECLSLIPMLNKKYQEQLRLHLKSDAYEVVLKSHNSMCRNIYNEHKKKSKWLVNFMREIDSVSEGEKISTLIRASNTYPTLVYIKMEIIKFVSVRWPEGYGRKQMIEVLNDCDEVISSLLSNNELSKLKYSDLFGQAKALVLSNSQRALVV